VGEELVVGGVVDAGDDPRDVEALFGQERDDEVVLIGLGAGDQDIGPKRAGGLEGRPVYIVPALEGRFFQPVRGLLTLSDWPLERLLVGPSSERADHLAATAQLARQLAWLSGRDSAVAQRLAPVVAGWPAPSGGPTPNWTCAS